MNADQASVTWRPLATSDAKAWAALLNAIEAEDKVGENYNEQDALEELQDPILDFERGTLAAFDGDVMVGYSLTTHKPLAETEHRVFVQGGVDPAYRRHGIGTRLLHAGMASAKDLHARHHPQLTLHIDVETGEHNSGAAALYRACGMAPVRWYQHMRHPLGDEIPETVLPAGLALEPYGPETDAEFHAIRNEAFLDHWGMSPLTDQGWRQGVVNSTFRPELSFLLRDEATGTAAGMLVTNYWEVDTLATGIRDAYIGLIGTRRAYRKRGVASALVAHTLRTAAEQGYGRASLGVDAGSPTGAVGLYEKLGFVAVELNVRYSVEG
jgi:mycothiol synthase